MTEENSAALFSKLNNELYFFDQWNPVTAAYDNMLAAGHLLHIQDQGIRNKLSEFRKRLDEIRSMEDLETRTFYERQSPFLAKHQDVNYSNWFDIYQLPVSPIIVDISPFESLEFWNLIVEWNYVLQDVISIYRSAETDCELIIELIDAELAATH